MLNGISLLLPDIMIRNMYTPLGKPPSMSIVRSNFLSSVGAILVYTTIPNTFTTSYGISWSRLTFALNLKVPLLGLGNNTNSSTSASPAFTTTMVMAELLHPFNVVTNE